MPAPCDVAICQRPLRSGLETPLGTGNTALYLHHNPHDSGDYNDNNAHTKGGEEGGNLAQMALQAQQRTKQQIPESLRLVFQKCCQPSETQRVTIDQTRNKACIINGQGENYTSCTS